MKRKRICCIERISEGYAPSGIGLPCILGLLSAMHDYKNSCVIERW